MPRKTLLCFFFVVVFSLMSVAVGRAVDVDECNAKSHKNPILLTGARGLNYDIVGRAIAEAYNKTVPPDEQITPCRSEGSLQNVQKLASNEATFALVQSDVAHAVWFNHPVLKGDDPCFPISAKLQDESERLQLITPLYTEVLHILVRPHLNVAGLADSKTAPSLDWKATERRVFYRRASFVRSGCQGVRHPRHSLVDPCPRGF